MANVLRIDALWDPEASVWVVTSEDVPGLVTEAATVEKVEEKVRLLAPRLLELNDDCLDGKAYSSATSQNFSFSFH